MHQVFQFCLRRHNSNYLSPNIRGNVLASIYQLPMMAITNETLILDSGASKVSGFYGPGSLIAWWMQCASFALDICFKPESTPPQRPPTVVQRIRSYTGQLFWSCLSLSVVAGFAYIAQRDLKDAAHDKRSPAAFHAPVAVLLQYNLITFIFLALRLGRLVYDFLESYYRYHVHRRDNTDADAQDAQHFKHRLRVLVSLGLFSVSTVVILSPSALLLHDTKALVIDTLRDCNTLEDPPANSSLTCLESYGNFLDTYAPGKAGSTKYLTAKNYPVPRAIYILTDVILYSTVSLAVIHYTSSYRASWRDRPGWRGRLAAVESTISAIKGRLDTFSNLFIIIRFSGVIIAPDAIMWIMYGRFRGLMPLTTTSLGDQDQMASVALGGLAFLSSQKDLIIRSWGLIEKGFFWVFDRNPDPQESVDEPEPVETLDNIVSKPHRDGRGDARERRPKT